MSCLKGLLVRRESLSLTLAACWQGYFKGPLGRSGLGPLSVGFIFDKTLDV